MKTNEEMLVGDEEFVAIGEQVEVNTTEMDEEQPADTTHDELNSALSDWVTYYPEDSNEEISIDSISRCSSPSSIIFSDLMPSTKLIDDEEGYEKFKEGIGASATHSTIMISGVESTPIYLVTDNLFVETSNEVIMFDPTEFEVMLVVAEADYRQIPVPTEIPPESEEQTESPEQALEIMVVDGPYFAVQIEEIRMQPEDVNPPPSDESFDLEDIPEDQPRPYDSDLDSERTLTLSDASDCSFTSGTISDLSFEIE